MSRPTDGQADDRRRRSDDKPRLRIRAGTPMARRDPRDGVGRGRDGNGRPATIAGFDLDSTYRPGMSIDLSLADTATSHWHPSATTQTAATR
jgi:hypothetical protein